MAATDELKSTPRVLLAICTAYVLLPAVFGLLCLVMLLLGGTQHKGARGLLVGALSLVLFLPLAMLQLIAITKHNSRTATSVSFVYFAFFVLLVIGALQVVILGGDDETPFRIFPDGLVIALLLSLNFFTAATMRKYSDELESKASAVNSDS